MGNTSNTRKTAISLPEDLYQEALDYCQNNWPAPIAFSGLVQALLKEFLENEKRKNQSKGQG